MTDADDLIAAGLYDPDAPDAGAQLELLRFLLDDVGASIPEVVQAQEAVALANQEYISALYLYNVSKAVLARGLGVAEELVRQFLGGVR